MIGRLAYLPSNADGCKELGAGGLPAGADILLVRRGGPPVATAQRLDGRHQPWLPARAVLRRAHQPIACRLLALASSSRDTSPCTPPLRTPHKRFLAGCYFVEKAWHAQAAGARAVLVADDVDEALITMVRQLPAHMASARARPRGTACACAWESSCCARMPPPQRQAVPEGEPEAAALVDRITIPTALLTKARARVWLLPQSLLVVSGAWLSQRRLSIASPCCTWA